MRHSPISFLNKPKDNTAIRLDGLSKIYKAQGLSKQKNALKDKYFIVRKLFPNVDFYSGITLRAMGISESFFTVIFALGRMPGWLSQWNEMHASPGLRISRPRQLYTGSKQRNIHL